MTLVKTSILSFFATLAKMIAGLVINKVVAIYIGPAGLASIGQFQNFIQLSTTAASGAINTGLTKYAAEYKQCDGDIVGLFSTAFRIGVCCSVIVGLSIVVFAHTLSAYILGSDQYTHVFQLFGVTIIFFVINSMLIAMLNGLKEVGKWFRVNISQSLLGILFTTSLIYVWGLEGALIALVTNQSIILFVVLYLLRDHVIITFSNLMAKYDSAQAKKLYSYAAMAITSAAVVPISHMVLRSYISDHLGMDAAGYWQAIWYISAMYLMVLTSTLSIYYLPRLSEISDKKEMRSEVLLGLKIIVPVAAISAFLIFLCRDIILIVLFSDDFSPVSELFAWQLIGDVVKIGSWIIAYIMLAKAKIKSFLITEIVFSMLFVFLAVVFINSFGLVGVTYAFTINYFLYLITVYFVVRGELRDSAV